MLRRGLDGEPEARCQSQRTSRAATVKMRGALKAIKAMNRQSYRKIFVRLYVLSRERADLDHSPISQDKRIGGYALARARHTYAEDDILVLYGFDVAALGGGFGRDLFFAGRVEACLGEVVTQGVGAVFGDLREGFAQLLVRKGLAFGEKV